MKENYLEKVGFERLLEYKRKLSSHISLWLSTEETSKIKSTSSILYHYLPWWKWQLIFWISKVQTACKSLYNACLGFLCNLCTHSDLPFYNLYEFSVLPARKSHKCQRKSSLHLGICLKVCLHFTRTKHHGEKYAPLPPPPSSHKNLSSYQQSSTKYSLSSL